MSVPRSRLDVTVIEDFLDEFQIACLAKKLRSYVVAQVVKPQAVNSRSGQSPPPLSLRSLARQRIAPPFDQLAACAPADIREDELRMVFAKRLDDRGGSVGDRRCHSP